MALTEVELKSEEDHWRLSSSTSTALSSTEGRQLWRLSDTLPNSTNSAFNLLTVVIEKFSFSNSLCYLKNRRACVVLRIRFNFDLKSIPSGEWLFERIRYNSMNFKIRVCVFENSNSISMKK